MEKIIYLVGIQPEIITDFYYPVMRLLQSFHHSSYANNIKMYAHSKTYKMIADPIYSSTFDETPDSRKVHIFMIEGHQTLIDAFKKYVDEGEAWKRWDVAPYLEFTRDNDGNIVPIKWYDEKFKKFLNE